MTPPGFHGLYPARVRIFLVLLLYQAGDAILDRREPRDRRGELALFQRLAHLLVHEPGDRRRPLALEQFFGLRQCRERKVGATEGGRTGGISAPPASAAGGRAGAGLPSPQSRS